MLSPADLLGNDVVDELTSARRCYPWRPIAFGRHSPRRIHSSWHRTDHRNIYPPPWSAPSPATSSAYPVMPSRRRPEIVAAESTPSPGAGPRHLGTLVRHQPREGLHPDKFKESLRSTSPTTPPSTSRRVLNWCSRGRTPCARHRMMGHPLPDGSHPGTVRFLPPPHNGTGRRGVPASRRLAPGGRGPDRPLLEQVQALRGRRAGGQLLPESCRRWSGPWHHQANAFGKPNDPRLGDVIDAMPRPGLHHRGQGDLPTPSRWPSSTSSTGEKFYGELWSS